MNLIACSRSIVAPPGGCAAAAQPPTKLSLLAALRARLGRREMTLRLHQVLQVLVERLHADAAAPVWIAEYICATLFSRIRLRIAGVPIMISCAATRPVPSLVLQQRLRDHRAQRLRQHRADHLLLRRREHVDDAVDGLGGRARCAACRTPGGRSRAAVSARRIVSRSRISPTRMTSGSSRSALRSALENDSVCGPTSRWLIRHFLRLVHELDRVLDREDVAVLVLVDVVDHRRERGRLARAGRAGDQHQAARLVGDLREDLRAPSGPRATAPSTGWSGTPRRRRGSGRTR